MIVFIGLTAFVFVSAQEEAVPISVLYESFEILLAEIQANLDAIQAEIETLQSAVQVSAQETESLFGEVLGLKARGEDVERLQELLKQSPEIYPEGLVTGYFGPLTLAAVKRFQEKYAEDILAPLSLIQGTGFVGELTIAKLDELYGSASSVSAGGAPSEEEESVSTEEPMTPADEDAPVTEEPIVEEDDVVTEEEDETPVEEEVVTPPSSGGGGGGGGPSPAADTTAPSAISNLATSNLTGSSVDLTWSATGDDGSSGTATSYDARYSTSEITSANWSSATQVSGEPTPKVSGLTEVFSVSGLSSSTTYYFAVKTSDEAGNESGISNTASGATTDAIAPGDISDLSASNPTSSSVDLTWSAPGDDGSLGTATSYDARYSTSAITEENWSSATQISGEPTPAASGANQSMTVSGLSSGTTYYFGMKTSDEALNQSGVSNIVSSATDVECTPIASGKQTYFVSTQNIPQIMQLDLDPLDVEVGAEQIVTVKIRDTNENPIADVTGSVQIDNGSNSFSLSLIAGTDLDGTWEGIWVPTGTFCTNYMTTITATSASGVSTVDVSMR